MNILFPVNRLLYFGKKDGETALKSGSTSTSAGASAPKSADEATAKQPKRKLTDAEKAQFKRRDELAVQIREFWPDLLKLIFPMPPNGEIKHAFVEKAHQAFQEMVSGVALSDGTPADRVPNVHPLFTVSKRSLFHRAEAAFLQQVRTIEHIFKEYEQDVLGGVSQFLAARMRQGLLKDELILHLLKQRLIDTNSSMLRQLSCDVSRVRAVKTMARHPVGSEEAPFFARLMLDIQSPETRQTVIGWLKLNHELFNIPVDEIEKSLLRIEAISRGSAVKREATDDALVSESSPIDTDAQVVPEVGPETGPEVSIDQLIARIMWLKRDELISETVGLFKGLSGKNADKIRQDFVKTHANTRDSNIVLGVAAAVLTQDDERTRFSQFNHCLKSGTLRATFAEMLALDAFDEGYDREKILLIRTVPGSSKPEAHRKAALLFAPITDREKAMELLSVGHQMQHARSERWLGVVAGCAAMTLQDPEERQFVAEQMKASGVREVIHGLDLTHSLDEMAQWEKRVGHSGYGALMARTIADYLAEDLPLTRIPQYFRLMHTLGRDPGDFTKEVIPAYQALVEYAVSHPDRLVHAGDRVPTEAEIREKFRELAATLIPGIIVVGAAPFKQVTFQKKLENLVALTHQVLGQHELLPFLYQLSRVTQNPYQLVKLLELTCSFVIERPGYPLKDLLQEMAAAKKLDIPRMGGEYLKQYFKDMGVSVDKISEDQLEAWNMEYISALAGALRNFGEQDKEDLERLCVKTLQGNYWQYIHDPSHRIGKANEETQTMFKEAFAEKGVVLDYDAWLHYDGVIAFDSLSGENAQTYFLGELSDIYRQLKSVGLTEPVRTFRRDIENYGFELDAEGKIQPKESIELYRFLSDIRYFMREVSDSLRYLDRGTHLGKGVLAENQKWLDSLKRRLTALEAMVNKVDHRHSVTEPLEIKLWQRQPGYDLFQGIYTGACTALSNNSTSTPEALEHTFVQIAELRNTKTKQTVGKALFFWAKDIQTGEPILVLNTFEGRGKHSNGCEENPYVRNKMLEFARAYGEKVAGRPVPIVIGISLNPLYTDDLEQSYHSVQVIGRTKKNTFYLDAISNSTGNLSADHERQRFYQAPIVCEPVKKKDPSEEQGVEPEASIDADNTECDSDLTKTQKLWLGLRRRFRRLQRALSWRRG